MNNRFHAVKLNKLNSESNNANVLFHRIKIFKIEGMRYLLVLLKR